MKIKTRVPLLLIISMLLLAIVMSACSPSTPPEEVAEIFFEYLTNFEHQRAYDFFSEKKKNELQSKDINRESFFGHLKAPIGHPLWMGIAVKVEGREIDDQGVAHVAFTLKEMSSKQAINGECQLIIEDNLWKVNHLILNVSQDNTQRVSLNK